MLRSGLRGFVVLICTALRNPQMLYAFFHVGQRVSFWHAIRKICWRDDILCVAKRCPGVACIIWTPLCTSGAPTPDVLGTLNLRSKLARNPKDPLPGETRNIGHSAVQNPGVPRKQGSLFTSSRSLRPHVWASVLLGILGPWGELVLGFRV